MGLPAKDLGVQLQAIRQQARTKGMSLSPALPLLFGLRGKPYSLSWSHFMFEPMFVVDQMPRRMMLLCGRQVSKTLQINGRGQVYLANGRPVDGHTLQVGDKVLSFDEEAGTPVAGRVVDLHRASSKPCIRVTTRMGTVIDMATTHPLLTPSGYVAGADLQPGQPLAAVRRGGAFSGAADIPTQHTILTAHMIGDGCCDRSSTKFIPDWVFDLSREDTVEFVQALWSTGGSVQARKSSYNISYATVSRQLAYQLKALLLKFGIITSVHLRQAGYKPDSEYRRCRDIYVLHCEGREAQERFLDTFSGLEKLADSPPENSGLRYADCLRGKGADDHRLESRCGQEIVWDEIVSIEPVGEQDCWDIEVDTYHNYVVDGVVSHNSTSMAASQILRAAIMPNYNILTVMPLYEQVRKFSQNYVRPFIITSPIKSRLISDLGTDSVLQRQIGPIEHNSSLFYSYSSGDPNRVRGIPADEVDCLAAGTLVTLASGEQTPVEDLVGGERILSCDADGISSNEVSRIVMQGTRPTWRIALADGRQLEVSDHEILATDQGWMCVADIAAAAAPPGYPAGRREYVENLQAPALPSGAGGTAARLRLGEVRGAEAACKDSTTSNTQQWSRLDHLDLLDVDDRAVPADLGSVLPGRQETGDAGVAGSTHPGGSRLDLDGRWSLWQNHRCTEHAGVQPAGERTHSILADLSGLRRFRVSRQGAVLACSAIPRGVAESGRAAAAVRNRLAALQDPTHSSPSDTDLSKLWNEVPGEEQPSGNERGMRRIRLLALAEPSAQPQVYEAAWAAGSKEHTNAGALPEQPGTRTGSLSREASEAHGRSGEACTYQRQETGTATVEKAQLQPIGVVSVEYAGEQPVYDVCLRDKHTLFANGVLVRNCDEIQDLDHSDLPIIESCMGASPYKVIRYTGTPKTFDNTAHLLWEDSSQARWVIPCGSCGKHNRAAVDGDLLKMIGDCSRRPDGSARTLICAKCGAPLNSYQGFYVHDYPERRLTFPGYHAPQPILPMHYTSPKDWQVIVETMNNKPTYVFFNEVLGESYDAGSKIITQEQLHQACTGPSLQPNEIRRSRYISLVQGVDWGGRGKEKASDTDDFISNTALALAGMRPDGVVEIPWLHKVPYAVDMSHESEMVANVAGDAGCDYVAMDYGGQGNVQEQQVRARGWPIDQIVPFTYAVMAPTRPIVFYNPPGHRGVRSSYTLDKPRSILLLCELIKRGLVVLPDDQRYIQDHLRDFLNVYEESIENPSGSPRRLIKRLSRRTDDVVHAVNFAVMALYHYLDRWPEVAKAFIEVR